MRSQLECFRNRMHRRRPGCVDAKHRKESCEASQGKLRSIASNKRFSDKVGRQSKEREAFG